ncbi:MAG TPA: tetratricopeptide repeat protein [Smithella sp.]|nr:tetratricopeptide repeat protein [Smithella sp.]
MKNNTIEGEHAEFLNVSEELFRQNNLLQALNLARERLRSYPVDADAQIVMCDALIGMGRLDDAREVLRNLEEIISGLIRIYEEVGDTYRVKGFHQDAAICYEKVISLHPGAQKAREVIGKMFLLEQEDNPVPEVDVVHHENIPEPEFFTITLAQLYIKQGHLQDAEIILEEIIKKEPQNAQALAMLDELKASPVSSSSSNGKNPECDNLMKTLSSWLENIERLRIHAAEK